MIIKIGTINIAGPGYICVETGNKGSQATLANQDGFIDCDNGDDPDKNSEDYSFKVYCQQDCDLVRAYELFQRVKDEIAQLLGTPGHLPYYKNYDGYILRRTITGAIINQTDFELQYKSKRTVAFELTITVLNTRLIGPVIKRNFDDVNWITDTIKAKLVMSDSTVPDEQATAVTLADFSDLDEFDGTGYLEQTLIKKVVAQGYRAGDVTYPVMDNGTRPISGIVIYRDSDDTFLGYIDATLWAGGQFDPDGNSITFHTNIAGLLV